MDFYETYLNRPQICMKTFKNHLRRNAHWRIMHSGRPKYPCDNCDRKFLTRENLKKHAQTVHTKTERRPRLPCEFPGCAKTYLNKVSVMKHFRAEHAKVPDRYGCTLCGKEFKARGDLRLHISSHTTKKTNKCETCGRSFTQLCSLRVHEVILT